MKTIITALFALCIISLTKQGDSTIKVNRFHIVEDSVTAVKVAEVLFLTHYGKDVLNQKPYDVELIGDTAWRIKGILKKPTPGGVAYIEIRRNDCKVLVMSHGK